MRHRGRGDIQCPDCGLDLEVLSVQPPELAPAPEEEEDWGEFKVKSGTSDMNMSQAR